MTYGSPASSGADGFLRQRVLTASPAELTAMLFDAAVGASRAGARHAAAGDWASATERLRHAQDVVLELRASVDTDATGDAGELAHRLGALHTWTWQRLLHASTRRDAAAITEALAALEPLRDAWRSSVLQIAA